MNKGFNVADVCAVTYLNPGEKEHSRTAAAMGVTYSKTPHGKVPHAGAPLRSHRQSRLCSAWFNAPCQSNKTTVCVFKNLDFIHCFVLGHTLDHTKQHTNFSLTTFLMLDIRWLTAIPFPTADCALLGHTSLSVRG